MRLAAGALVLILSVGTAGAALMPPDLGSAERTEANCLLVAQEEGLRGAARESSVQACVAQVSPSLAYWESCRSHGRRKHLKGLALRDDVRACLSREP